VRCEKTLSKEPRGRPGRIILRKKERPLDWKEKEKERKNNDGGGGEIPTGKKKIRKCL